MSYLFFKATKQQLKEIIKNAVNASRPMGMGFLQFEEKDYTPEEIKLPSDIVPCPIYVDYFAGRMVKLHFALAGDDRWKTRNEVELDYQSWARKYPTTLDLLKASGIEEYDLKEEKHD